MISLSIGQEAPNRNNPDSYKYVSVNFETLSAYIISNDINTSYSASQFNGRRKKDNVVGTVDLLILDIDEGCSLNSAVEIFARYNGYIFTTKSHQKDKGGVICDRFRVILKLEKPLLKDEIEDLYKAVLEIYPFCDKATKDSSRMFYCSPSDARVFRLTGKHDYPIDYIVISSNKALQDTETKKEYQSLPKQDKWIKRPENVIEHNEMNDDMKLKGVNAFLDKEFYQGNKSNCLFKASCMMKDDGFDDNYIVDYLMGAWDNRKGAKDRFRDALQNIKGGLKV